MQLKLNHKIFTGLVVFAFILLSVITSFAETVADTYDNANRLIRANE